MRKIKGMSIDMNMGPMMPQVTFSDEELPELKNWKVGETYRIVAEVEQVSMDKMENGKMNARFKFLKVGDASKKVEDMSKKEFKKEKEEVYTK